MQRLQQVSSFKCEMTGMIQLHNYLAYVRETKSAQKILILDISKTSSLTVADEQVITVEMLSENDSPTPKLPADALSNKSDSRIIVNASELGLFKCQLLDDSKEAIEIRKEAKKVIANDVMPAFEKLRGKFLFIAI